MSVIPAATARCSCGNIGQMVQSFSAAMNTNRHTGALQQLPEAVHHGDFAGLIWCQSAACDANFHSCYAGFSAETALCLAALARGFVAKGKSAFVSNPLHVKQKKPHVLFCCSAELKLITMTTVVLSNPFHALQAFTAAVQSVLRGQTCALQQLPEAVKQRRTAEQSHSSMAAGRRTESQQGLPAVTVLEVVLHTEKLQVMLQRFVSSKSSIVTKQCHDCAVGHSTPCSRLLHHQVIYKYDSRAGPLGKPSLAHLQPQNCI